MKSEETDELQKKQKPQPTSIRVPQPNGTLYIDQDDSGCLCPERRSSNPATIARSARLAPDIQARSGELVASGEGLRVRLLSALPAGGELLLWFHESLLATVDMPFLTLKNIRGKKDYVCHDCDVQFEHPNHLKVHLFLQCREYSPSVFWRKFHSKLTAALTPTTDRLSAFRPYTEIISSPIPAPAQLEALAAEWGKSTNGHLCLYCGKIYSRKYGLKIHIRTHTGYKPLRCRYCLRAFGDPSNLNKHVRLHANEGNESGEHACPFCGKRLARRRDLLRHVRARHADALSSKAASSPCAVP
ncbi:zinc finger protein 333 [Amyelois transitella]|uniref:zinc finger protein 333 n=1 Tax=Amyelois transitella TaxID=680683 RepID=UPI00067B5EA1|nr:zinc finger protein 333 [Amyelois transitella]